MATQKGGKTAASTSKPAARKRSSGSSQPKTHVRLRGRFRPGTQVRLYEASGPEQLRPGGDPVDEVEVDEHGTATFTKGITEGARYFVSGHHDGFPLDVRATGRKVGDSEGSVAQPPVQNDDVFHKDGVRAGNRGTPKAEPPARTFVDEDGRTHTEEG